MLDIFGFLKYIFEQIPEPYRPLVAFVLLVLYVVTKARSHMKDAENSKSTGWLVSSYAIPDHCESRPLPPPTGIRGRMYCAMSRLINIVF